MMSAATRSSSPTRIARPRLDRSIPTASSVLVPRPVETANCTSVTSAPIEMIATPISSITWTTVGTTDWSSCSIIGLFAGFPQRQPDQSVQPGVGAELVLSGVDCGAGLGRPEAEVAEGGERVGRGPGAWRWRERCTKASDAELALKLVGDAGGELGPHAVGSADHRLVTLADGARELVGREDRKDGEREAAAHALD